MLCSLCSFLGSVSVSDNCVSHLMFSLLNLSGVSVFQILFAIKHGEIGYNINSSTHL